MKPSDINVVILCGGKGSRLQEVVNDRPKPMAQINERPFLEILIDYFSGFGFKRFILCTGYMSEAVERYYTDQRNDLQIVISKEDKPLGTGGALKNAEKYIQSDHFIVTNGDSYCHADLSEMLDFHFQKQALMTMVLVESKAANDAGTVRMDESGHITDFQEKIKSEGKCYINAGIYLFPKSVLSGIKGGQRCSLEYDLFPKLITADCFGYISNQKLIDIGTPQRLEKARKHFEKSRTNCRELINDN